jgi:tetratricopeptide (TPR) repeat protein
MIQLLKRNRPLPQETAGGKDLKANRAPSVSTSLAGLPAGQRWLFRCLLILVVPLLLVCLLEAGLRLFSIGHPTTFLLRKQIGARTMLLENPWFGLRFFPPALARSPSPICIPGQKPPGTFRIFLFGESAALGDPRPAYGVGRYLETLLSKRFPGTQFEVVCLAMTAINSHAIVPIARECARYQGDCWIVYMGNNEFAGPFGANTVFGPQAPPAWAVHLFLAVQNTRIGQCLISLARQAHRSQTTPTSWGGLKMFLDHQLAPEDPRRERVYRNFERNLDDLVLSAQHARVPVLLSSVASNLKDCAPFGSFPPADTNTSPIAEWQVQRDLAATNALQGRLPAAIAHYLKAVELKPATAELRFELGQCFLAVTNIEAARESLSRARDLDTLPFRADSRINEIIARTAQRPGGKDVAYVDAEQILASQSASHIPGAEFFYEHVHLNWTGNYQLALAFARQILRCMPAEILRQDSGAWPSPAECAERLGLTDWNRYSILEEILRRLSEPPFTSQLNHWSQMDHLTNAMVALRRRMQPQAVQQARSMFETALKQYPQDHWLHHNYAEFLTKTGDLPEATEEMRMVCKLLPENHAGYLQLGRLLARQKKYDEALSPLKTALRLRPDVFDVRIELGQVLAAKGAFDEALNQYAEAQHCRGEEDAKVHLLEADVFARQHKRSESITHLRQAIRLQPAYAEAHELLGMQLALDSQHSAAQAEFETAVRLRPDYSEGHLNLGIALARQRRFNEALEQFEATLRLEPQNAQAKEFISSIKGLQAQSASP